MPTTTAPPILIWQPGGGTPIGPVSNPPVYSQAGITPLIQGQAYVDVVFGSIQTDNNWVLVECDVVNTADGSPLNIWQGLITSKTTAGFRVWLNGLPDSGNYYLHWAVSGINITPSPASTYRLTGPSSGPYDPLFILHSSNFTVSLPPSTTVPGLVTITPNDGGAGGTFSPASVTVSTASASATFTYIPAAYGTVTIGTTNSSSLLSDPVALSFTAVVSTYTLSGPASGGIGSPSSNFTVALPGGSSVIGTVTITPNDGGGGGTFTPTTVGLTTGSPSATFTYTPSSSGTKTISVTNNGGLTNPGSISYVATAPPFDPSSIAGLFLWLKADALVLTDGASVSTWADSSGTGNNFTQGTGANQPIFKTAIVNGKPVVRFNGSSDVMVIGTEALLADFTILVAYQTSGDGLLVGSKTANEQLLRIGDLGNNRYSLYDGVSTLNGTVLSALRSAWNIGCVIRSGGTASFFESGVARGTGASAGGTVVLGAVGALVSPSALFTNGDIAEVLAYSGALSSTDRNNVEGYLRSKYAIP